MVFLLFDLVNHLVTTELSFKLYSYVILMFTLATSANKYNILAGSPLYKQQPEYQPDGGLLAYLQ